MNVIKTHIPSSKPSLAAMAAKIGAPSSSIMKEAAAETSKSEVVADPKKEGIPVELQVQNRKPLTPAQEKALAAASAKAKSNPATATRGTPPSQAKAQAKAKSAKPTKSGKPRADRKASGPSGLVADCLKLAARSRGDRRLGVDATELNETTKWTGAPWKWLFHNPKNTGWCQRWGYDLTVFTGADGEKRYFVEKFDGSRAANVKVEAAPAKVKADAKPAPKAKSAGKAKAARKSKKAPKARAKKKAA